MPTGSIPFQVKGISVHIVSQMATVLQRTLNVTKITANVSRDMPFGLRTELVCPVCKIRRPGRDIL